MSMSITSRSPLGVSLRVRFGARGLIIALVIFVLTISAEACSPEKLLGDQSLPPDVPDPAQTHTPAGALASYVGALTQLRSAFGGDVNSFIPISGLLTDELRSGDLGQIGAVTDPLLIDSRFLPEDPGIGDDIITAFPMKTVYGLLQRTRGQAREARGALHAYAPGFSPALTGHLYAAEGFADVFLADLFCSGIPLSTLDFNGDYTYQSGSTTEQVYQRANALFDSAITLAADSERVVNLARVGKGRALLALGEYDAAAAAVAGVPDDFQYAIQFDLSQSGGSSTVPQLSNRNYVWHDFGNDGDGLSVTLVDVEGGNGLSYLESGDPRSAWVDNGVNRYGRALTRPAKYSPDGDGPIVLADGIEARLIQAEAALRTSGSSWLAMLNALRTDGTFDTQPNADHPATTDTLWHAGTGGVAGLAPLHDPVDPDARVTMLFGERGYWLFLTGHRQGDLRRLIRQYGRQSQNVYPAGLYPGAHNVYGNDVTAPIPGAERVSNTMFTGCRNRGA
jgi:hypothetical protein